VGQRVSRRRYAYSRLLLSRFSTSIRSIPSSSCIPSCLTIKIERAESGEVKYVTIKCISASIANQHKKLNLDWQLIYDDPESLALRAVINRRKNGNGAVYRERACQVYENGGASGTSTPPSELELQRHDGVIRGFRQFAGEDGGLGVQGHVDALRNVLGSRSVRDDRREADEEGREDAMEVDQGNLMHTEPRNANGMSHYIYS
jgi:hypothetical protein